MLELIKIISGILLLGLGIPIGNLLAKVTKEELASGKRWFKILIEISLFSAVVCLIFRRDDLMFALLFIAIVTSRSLILGNKKLIRKSR